MAAESFAGGMAAGIDSTRGKGLGLLSRVFGTSKDEEEKKSTSSKGPRESTPAQLASLALKQQDTDMKRETLDMKKTEFSNEQNDRFTKQELKQGLNEAFSSGGYEGSLDYLKAHDMEMYYGVQKMKAETDASISKAIGATHQSEESRLKTIQERYLIMGKMGASILKVPEEDRKQVYQSVLPMIKGVYPDAPDEYNADMENRLTLAMGISMPDSMLYGAEKKAAKASTKIGKIQEDLLKYGEEGKDDSDPVVKALNSQLQAEIRNSSEAQLTAANNAPNEDALRNQYLKLNSNFLAVKDQWNQIKDYNDDVATPMGDMKLIYAYNKSMNPNDSVKEGEFANTTNAAGWSDRTRNEYNKAIKGNMMASRLRNDMLAQSRDLYESFDKTYQGMQSQFTAIAVRRGLDPRNIVIDLDPQASAPNYDKRQMQAIIQANPGYTEDDARAAIDWMSRQKSKEPGSSSPPEEAPPRQMYTPGDMMNSQPSTNLAS